MRLLPRLRRRCAAPPPWRLADALPCSLPRGHPHEAHEDGQGYAWTANAWGWSGPPVDLGLLYSRDAAGQVVFHEDGEPRAG